MTLGMLLLFHASSAEPRAKCHTDFWSLPYDFMSFSHVTLLGAQQSRVLNTKYHLLHFLLQMPQFLALPLGRVSDDEAAKLHASQQLPWFIKVKETLLMLNTSILKYRCQQQFQAAYIFKCFKACISHDTGYIIFIFGCWLLLHIIHAALH